MARTTASMARSMPPDRWGTHVIEPAIPADAAYLVYARPGFAFFPVCELVEIGMPARREAGLGLRTAQGHVGLSTLGSSARSRCSSRR